MAHDKAYYKVEERIQKALKLGATELDLRNIKLIELPESIGQLKQLTKLTLCDNWLTVLPDSMRQLTHLKELDLSNNKLTVLPEWIGELTQLELLSLFRNNLTKLPDSLGELSKLKNLEIYLNDLETLPECISRLSQLEKFNFSYIKLKELPEWISQLPNLTWIWSIGNNLANLPSSLAQLEKLAYLDISDNPLNPELAEACKLGIKGTKAYLRAKAESQITLNEAKLILVGEGEVGKTCLMDALLDKPWQEHPSTHGIEIQRVKVTDPDSGTEINLNSWDFGGQRIYRPTHQLFFSAPAVYLVVWKPREGPQQGFVKEWIQLIKRREPTAKILVVATHGGPQQRQPDIDRQELWDLFGKETMIDFFFVDSKPDKNGYRKGIEELKTTIARVAKTLPEVGRSIPKSWEDVHKVLEKSESAYLPLKQVLAICRENKIKKNEARLFVTIEHQLGTLIHYQNDPTLHDIVILRPDWLATAMSYVLDDEETRRAHGLVKFSRLRQLWNDSTRPAETRYGEKLHPIFLRLMERFDLSYRVAEPAIPSRGDAMHRPYDDPQSLIAQLVPDNRPENIETSWPTTPQQGDIQQTQICRIVDRQTGQSATAEGLFYQLIVRLHKYSLGRDDYCESMHWQRGLVLDNAYNGRAFLEHKGNDVYITVRAPYPERFLVMLTEEVKYLVESFWEGLRCDVMVPCVAPCGKDKPGTNLFEVQKLIAFKRKGLTQFPCTNSGCEALQDIDQLLSNAPAATQPISLNTLLREFAQVKDKLDEVNDNTRRILSQVDKQYADLIQIFTDEAKEGPRLFSLFPLDGNKFNPKNWVRHQFRLVLWCEHSRLPLPALNGWDMKKGVYDLELEREWFKKAAPYLKLVTSTLSLVLPVASSALKVVNDTAFKSLEDNIGLGKDVIDAIAGEGIVINEFMGKLDPTSLEHGIAVRADGATLRELQTLLKAKDPGFGGLVRVMNKRQEFLWVHERFVSEY